MPPVPASSAVTLTTRVPAGIPATPLVSTPGAMSVISATCTRVVATGPVKEKPITSSSERPGTVPLSVTVRDARSKPVTVRVEFTPLIETIEPIVGSTDVST